MADNEKYDSIVLTFTAACHKLSDHGDKSAETEIIAFQSLPECFDICRYIMQTSMDDVVLFHTIMSYQASVMMAWFGFSAQDVREARQFILAFIENRYQDIPTYIMNQSAVVYAVITKRGWVTTLEGEEPEEVMEMRRTVLAEVGKYVQMMGNPLLQTVGLQIVDALVTEFECGKRANDLELGAEYHIQCFSSFETMELRDLFILVFSLLQELSNSINLSEMFLINNDRDTNSPNQTTHPAKSSTHSDVTYLLYSKALKLCSRIISWPFGQVAPIIGIYFSSSNSMRPPASWKDIFLSPNMELLGFFGSLFPIIRNIDVELALVVTESLAQLASLTGDTFGSSDTERKERKSLWIPTLSSLINSLMTMDKLSNRELRSIAQIIQRFLNQNSTSSILDTIGNENLNEFFAHASMNTIETMRRLQRLDIGHEPDDLQDFDEDLEVENTLLGEALDIWINAWSLQCQDYVVSVFPEISNYAGAIYNLYVETRLVIARTELIRSEQEESSSFSSHINGNDNLDTQPKSKQDLNNPIFVDQLNSVSALGRVACRQSIETLRSTIKTIVDDVIVFIEKGIANMESCCRLEELHWIIMMANYFLCHCSHGDLASIPLAVLRLAHHFDENEHEENTIIALIAQLMSIIDIENQVLFSRHNNHSSINQAFVWSPLLSETITWFLANWTSCYLFLSLQSSMNWPSCFLEHYGINSELSLSTLDLLIRKVMVNLSEWVGENDVLLRTCSLLNAITKLEHISLKLLSSTPSWNELIQHWTMHNDHITSSLPPQTQRALISALVSIVKGNEDFESEYLQVITAPILSSFTEFLTSNQIDSYNALNPEVIASVQVNCERLRGILKATVSKSASAVNSLLSQYWEALVNLVQVYKSSHATLVLLFKIFSEYGTFVLCHLIDEDYMMTFFSAFHQLCNVYESCGIGKRHLIISSNQLTRYVNQEAQNEQFEELVELFEVLGAIVENSGEKPAQLCFESASILIPYVDNDMLQHPTLCQWFFHFISGLFSTHASFIGFMDEHLFEYLLRSIEFGLQQHNQMITMACLDAIAKIASFNYKSMNQKGNDSLGQQKRFNLVQFIPYLLRWSLLEHGFKMDFISPLSSALLALICVDPDAYANSVNSILDELTDEHIKARMSHLFGELSNNMDLNWSRPAKEKFKTSLQQFVTVARSVLHKR